MMVDVSWLRLLICSGVLILQERKGQQQPREVAGEAEVVSGQPYLFFRFSPHLINVNRRRVSDGRRLPTGVW